MSRHVQLNLFYLSHGADNSTAMLVYHALRNEQERLITQLAKEHADQDYNKAAITNDELDRITIEMGRIATGLANECERLSDEIERLKDPKAHELIVKSYDKQAELAGLYDERFFDKPYKPGAEEGGQPAQ
ncbi:hypothetical protein [Larkinella terrae]|uniref:Uncharacterized protein n=1 Tax=Larkinella terrae TaxID=2025311 RepID=A0A7K0EJD7_9BACT|nr:hypothetical protein [Larkinella terrae]MRS61641.1 hypothetical protein [Larkinella terrae]